VTYRKKLIEVALPLEAINREAAREKSIRHGHPSTLHLWWARRPLAACRAVLFASLVDDPSSHPEKFPDEVSQNAERQRLFRIIEELVKWENVTNERVLGAARAEIVRCCEGRLPPVYDPFAGGGSIPLEAQRLGLEAHASDLNPVPVLINKALIELPPKFAGRPPVNPESRESLAQSRSWNGAEGLAEDIRYYGQWMRTEAEKRIGKFYPAASVVREAIGSYRHATTAEIENQETKIENLTVIAWLWARTIASPNPAAKGAHVPLVRSFWLSTKPGKKAWVEPVVDAATMTYRFEVRTGDGKPREGTVKRGADVCLLTGTPMSREHIRSEGVAGRMGMRLMAIVAEGARGRIYLPPSEEHEALARTAVPPDDVPDTDIKGDLRYLTPVSYGMTKHRHLFTDRQLVALTTFCDLVGEAWANVILDAAGAERSPAEAEDYANAVATYLAFAVDRVADRLSTIATWDSSPTKLQLRNTFARQALQMTWDFGEGNPFADSSGTLAPSIDFTAKVAAALPANVIGYVHQLNAEEVSIGPSYVFSTDPPYYDNVPYADLSDFFYVWLRRSLGSIYPDLLGTVLVPKAEELVADPFRHGGKDAARRFFEEGMGRVFTRILAASDPRFPTTIYYAFKQEEAGEEDPNEGEEESGNGTGRSSTGWETFLQGLVDAGWQIDGTWPMRTELGNRMRGLLSNALASSIVLVCRARSKDAATATRREFVSAMKRELPGALRALQSGNIAPVDLAQAAIGPGMAVYSRYARVLEADGTAMNVRTALSLINQLLDEVLAEGEGDFEPDTRWALAWFEQHGFDEGAFGSAETLATAKNTSINGLVSAGFLHAKAGKVRLLHPGELPADWSPVTDGRLTVWEMTHHLVRLYHTRAAGDPATAALLRQLGSRADAARDLAYRLFALAERRKRSADAQGYNALVLGWPELARLAQESPSSRAPTDGEFDLGA
jgi:putative DNA methylase